MEYPKAKAEEVAEEVAEKEEAESILSDMVKDLNELPTPVLRQLLDNLDAIEAYNRKHGLSSGSSHGAYAIAALEELLEHNDPFLSICLLDEHIKTRLIDESKPLRAILLFEKEKDVEIYGKDRSWVDSIAHLVSYEAKKEEGYYEVIFRSDWGLLGELTLICLKTLEIGLPKKLEEDLSRGFRIALSKPGFGEEFFLGLLSR